MLTFQSAISEQDDLAQLCADRPIKTKEIFGGNSFYGNDYVLKMYASLPHKYRLKVVIPHGVTFDPEFIWRAERTASLPAVFCYQGDREETYSSQTKKRVLRGTAPFLYARELVKDHLPSSRHGLIFFPSHSTHHLSAYANYEEIADDLSNLPQKYQPISVCIYWRDYNLGHYEHYVDRGLKVISAGHMYDRDFLFRLVYLLSMHQYASGNALGSHIFYSTLSECEYFHFEGYDHATEGDDDFPQLPVKLADRIRILFRENPSDIEKEEQRKISKHYLGANNLLSPVDLRRMLLKAELLDKMGSTYWKRLIAPTILRRLLIKLKTKTRMSWKNTNSR